MLSAGAGGTSAFPNEALAFLGSSGARWGSLCGEKVASTTASAEQGDALWQQSPFLGCADLPGGMGTCARHVFAVVLQLHHAHI